MTREIPLVKRNRGSAPRTLSYYRIDLIRTLRMITNLIFVIALPVLMFLIFGGMMPFGEYEHPSGLGNVAATIMVTMAMYGAITATTSISGMAAVEMQQGWGRQLGLTPFANGSYVAAKVGVALTIAMLPVFAVFLAGAITGAKVTNWWAWLLCAVLIIIGATVFALYGLAFGLLFRSESAVGAASGLLVILMFLGDAFVPLSGFLLDLAPFTPVWGVMKLAGWPITNGIHVMTDGNQTEYALWQPIVNIVAWALVFGATCLWAARRQTHRR